MVEIGDCEEFVLMMLFEWKIVYDVVVVVLGVYSESEGVELEC